MAANNEANGTGGDGVAAFGNNCNGGNTTTLNAPPPMHPEYYLRTQPLSLGYDSMVRAPMAMAPASMAPAQMTAQMPPQMPASSELRDTLRYRMAEIERRGELAIAQQKMYGFALTMFVLFLIFILYFWFWVFAQGYFVMFRQKQRIIYIV